MEGTLNPIVGIGIQIAVLILLGFILTRAIKRGLTDIFSLKDHIETESQQIKVTVMRHVISVIQTIIWVVIILSIAALLRMRQFVEVLTILGVIVGYVAREFVMDIIMGVVILVEQQFRVGDTVTFTTINQNSTGKVTEIGIRTTKVRLRETGDTYIVSNRVITSVIVHRRKLPKGARQSNVSK